MASKLPPEVLLEICSFLSVSDLHTCLMVSRTWYDSVAYSYYHTIRIKDSKNQLVQFRDYILNSTLPVCNFIRHIQIENDPTVKHTAITKQAFQDILSLCSNLRELTMTKNSIYWQHLYEFPIDFKPFRLASLGRKGYVDEEYYYKASHKFCNTITDLEIHRSCDGSIYQTYSNLFNYLSNFKQLKRLSITSGSRKHIIHLDQLLKTCKGLESLSYQIDHPFAQLELDKAVYPSIHALDIFLANFSISSLQHIVHRFISLKRFTLRINQNEQNPDIAHFFKSQFIPFLQSLEYSNIQFQINGRSTLEDMVCYMKNNSYTTNAHFHVHDGRAERTQISLLREKKSLDMNVTFVRDIATDQLDTLPYSAYLQTFGSAIEKLCITFTTQIKYHQVANMSSILSACPQIKQLSINLEQPPMAYLTSNNSTQPRYPTAQLPTTKGKFGLLLERLSLNFMTITCAFLQALARDYPLLKELSLVNCLSDSEFNHHSFDLTGLKLNMFVFDIIAYRRMNRDWSVCVAVEFDTQRCHYYLTLPCHSSQDLFSHISESELCAMDQEKMHMIKLKVNDGLKTLVLQAGQAQSFSRVIQF